MPHCPTSAADGPSSEVPLDFPREWLEFPDPDDADHLIRADLTWLLAHWRCIFGAGCRGVSAAGPADGCCSHGAFFTDGDDEKRVRRAAKRLTAATWQHRGGGVRRCTEIDELDGAPARRTATRAGGPCVFLNDVDFAGGGGCALHAQAERDGVHPSVYKPDVCWQLPVWWEQVRTTRPDETDVLVSTIGEYDRRRWGAGGHDLHWWCTSSPEAHISPDRVYQSYAAELTTLLGARAYARLAELCARRAEQGGVATHPATEAAAGASSTSVAVALPSMKNPV